MRAPLRLRSFNAEITFRFGNDYRGQVIRLKLMNQFPDLPMLNMATLLRVEVLKLESARWYRDIELIEGRFFLQIMLIQKFLFTDKRFFEIPGFIEISAQKMHALPHFCPGNFYTRTLYLAYGLEFRFVRLGRNYL